MSDRDDPVLVTLLGVHNTFTIGHFSAYLSTHSLTTHSLLLLLLLLLLLHWVSNHSTAKRVMKLSHLHSLTRDRARDSVDYWVGNGSVTTRVRPHPPTRGGQEIEQKHRRLGTDSLNTVVAPLVSIYKIELVFVHRVLSDPSVFGAPIG